jgi:broad specificity phosphatase PhoE
VALSPRGREQARRAGATLGVEWLSEALIYCSPYRRTRETLDGLLDGAGLARDRVRVYEDPRLREVEHGYGDVEAQEKYRKTHGWFYYRFKGGESPADCFDRTSAFLESMMRQIERRKSTRVLIVTHGLTLRCFVMRFLHLTIEQFDTMANPGNAEIVTIGPRKKVDTPSFTSGSWAVSGLRKRS